ncbi:metallophosphoesterase [uncultured Variovorax sp.]|uniref:metallophosphoesterase n=1 Tax=uncultured Variovorax sp. TaxID=114708 RepID=UPI00262B6504|nr:metallophosphoesterase [uncultured Variovorax sp.]
MTPLTPEDLCQLRRDLAEITRSSPRLRKVALNPHGRDFVIGDVHGAFDQVLQGMKAVGFNRLADRLFSVGDLIDRGAGSSRAGAFLDQPYVHAIPGNHEADLVDLYLTQDDPCGVLAAVASINFNGMGWLSTTTPDERIALVKRFASLPIAMEVQTARGTVGLVHGEVPRGMDWPSFTSAIEAGDKHTIASCLQGRTRLRSQDATGVPGIGRIFAGHTPQFDGATRLGNCYAIDTGAVFAELSTEPNAALTFADMAFKTGALFTPRPAGDARVLDDTTDEPFGNYAGPLP